MRRLTSVSFHLSRFTGVETSPVNEELQKNFPELFMQHLKREMCNGKSIFEQTRISTYYSYIRHIRAAINFQIWRYNVAGRVLVVALKVCLQKGPETDPDQPPFLLKHERRLTAWNAAKGMELVIKTRNSVNGTQISIGKFQPGKQDYLFRSSTFSGNFPVGRTKKSCSIYIPTGISGIFW